MGYLATVLSVTRSVASGAQALEAKVSRGGNDTITAYSFVNPGDDSYPLPGDVVFVVEAEGKGNGQVVGYQDPETSPVANAGEKRIYARSGPGVVSCEVWLKADGALVLKNTLGSLELDPAGNVTVTTPLGTYGAASHAHSTPFGPSGPPLPNT
jgi:hypothetical protein